MKLVLAATMALIISTAPLYAENPYADSLSSVTPCYHGVHTESPCTKNVLILSVFILGPWKAEDKAWRITFYPNHTLSMSTIGPEKSGKYKLEDGGSDSDYAIIKVDMDDGSHFQADIALFHSTLIILNGNQYTEFDRAIFSSQ